MIKMVGNLYVLEGNHIWYDIKHRHMAEFMGFLPHEVKLRHNLKSVTECYNWCKNNCQSYYSLDVGTISSGTLNPVTFFFHNVDDAMLFKLTWSGYR